MVPLWAILHLEIAMWHIKGKTSVLRLKVWVLDWCNNVGFNKKFTLDFSQFSLVNWRLEQLIFLHIFTVLWVSVLLFFPTVINVKMVQVVQTVAGSVSHLLDRGMNLSSALTCWDLSLEKQSAISKPKSSELTSSRSERKLEVFFLKCGKSHLAMPAKTWV